ncbi:MAG: CHAD domain-containing protein, partial [Hyphomicrobium sp.]
LSSRIETANDPGAKATARAEAAHRLRKAKIRILRLKLEPDSFDALSAGLEQSFRRAGKAFQLAYDEPSNENVHEWRKGAQQHWRHMLLLRRAWPELADARMHAARKLSQVLGDDHDLAILQHHLESTRTVTFSARDVRTVIRLAGQRQTELRALAKPLGEQLFADSARSLGRRFSAYWNAAQCLRALRTAGGSPDEAES